MTAFKLYITTKPGESEVRKIQDKLYEISARKKLADIEKVDNKKRKEEQDAKAKLENIEGRWVPSIWPGGTIIEQLDA